MDKYNVVARLQPSLYVLAPFVVTAWLWARPLFEMAAALVGVLIFCGLLYFFAQVSRRYGKRAESYLLTKWGGWPSTRLLRHRDDHFDAGTKARFHKQLEMLCPGSWRAPLSLEEVQNPDAADSAYREATTWLIAMTRDPRRFPMVFQENLAYGFRRNLFGMKALGIAVAGLSATLNLIGLLGAFGDGPALSQAFGALAFSLMALAGWLIWVNQAFVEESAVAYAQQLITTIDQLASGHAGELAQDPLQKPE